MTYNAKVKLCIETTVEADSFEGAWQNLLEKLRGWKMSSYGIRFKDEKIQEISADNGDVETVDEEI